MSGGEPSTQRRLIDCALSIIAPPPTLTLWGESFCCKARKCTTLTVQALANASRDQLSRPVRSNRAHIGSPELVGGAWATIGLNKHGKASFGPGTAGVARIFFP